MPDNIFADIGKFGAGALQTAGNIGIATLREIGAPGWHQWKSEQDWKEKQSVYDREEQEWTALTTLLKNMKPNTPEYLLFTQAALEHPLTKRAVGKINSGEELGRPYSKDVFEYGNTSDIYEQLTSLYTLFNLTGDETYLMQNFPKKTGESAEEYKINFENNKTVMRTRQLHELLGSQIEEISRTLGVPASTEQPETMAGSMSKPKADVASKAMENQPNLGNIMAGSMSKPKADVAAKAMENQPTKHVGGRFRGHGATGSWGPQANRYAAGGMGGYSPNITSGTAPKFPKVNTEQLPSEPPVEKQKQKPADVAPRPELQEIWGELSDEEKKTALEGLRKGISPERIIKEFKAQL